MYIHVFSTLDVNSLEGVLEMQILKTGTVIPGFPLQHTWEIKLVDNYCVPPSNKHD